MRSRPAIELEVYGDLGTMTYDFGTDVIQAGKVGDRALHEVELTPDLEGGWTVEDDFIAAVKSRGRNRPHPDFEDGVKYMRVVQAVADSRAAERVGRDRDSERRAISIEPRMISSAMLKYKNHAR